MLGVKEFFVVWGFQHMVSQEFSIWGALSLKGHPAISGDIFLVVIAEGFYWHLTGSGQGCC